MLTCDPTQRGWIAFDTYLPAVKIGEVVRSNRRGSDCGVEQSPLRSRRHRVRSPRLAGLCRGEPEGPTPRLPPGAPLELAMSALALTGVAAYFGLLDVGRPAAGETVVVSGGAFRSPSRPRA
jgi:hypothetical protein